MPIPAGGPKAVVWKLENRFSSKDVTREVPLKGIPAGASAVCGEYVCLSEENARGKKLVCDPFGQKDRPGEACFAQKFAYYTLDRFIRLLVDDLMCSLDAGASSGDCASATSMIQIREALKNRKMPLPVTVNAPDMVNAYYSPYDVELVFGDGEGKFLLATDGDIIVHEAAHWLIDTINPTLGSFSTGLGNAVHEGSADAIAALHFGDPQMAEDFNFYKSSRGSKLGLRTVHNTRTVANIKWMEEHETGKIISGFWWSLSERLLAHLKKSNKDAYRLNPALFGQLARNATLKLIFAHAGSYAIPNPDAPDFLEAVSRGATDLNFINGLPELTGHGVSLMTLLKEIAAEGKERRLDVPIWPMRSRGTASVGGTPQLGADIRITGAGGDRVAFRPQLYPTKHGPALVVGHGVIERNGDANPKGLRAIEPGDIDETVAIPRSEAFPTALSAVGTKLAELLAARTGEDEIPAVSRKRILALARKKLENGHATGAKLAILPESTGLVWLFDAGIADIAVDAQSGKAQVLFRGRID